MDGDALQRLLLQDGGDFSRDGGIDVGEGLEGDALFRFGELPQHRGVKVAPVGKGRERVALAPSQRLRWIVEGALRAAGQQRKREDHEQPKDPLKPERHGVWSGLSRDLARVIPADRGLLQ